jgi:dCMP deaminase
MNDLTDDVTRGLLKEAYAEATKSQDPSTQNGAVLAWSDKIIGRGYNRFACGVVQTPERLADRSQKYPRTAHAEENAIWDAVRNGHGDLLDEATLYVAWYACEKCAVAILESGVRRVVGHRQHPGVLTLHSKWASLVEVGLDMLREGGVDCRYYDDQGKGLGCQPLLLDYKHWNP